jgi:hypothetical protein
MQDSPATDRPPRWRAWLPRILALAVLAAAGVVALVRLEIIGGPTDAERAATVTAQLNDRMTTTLEKLPTEGHQGHGTATTGESRTVCGTRVYGYEPENARDVDAVKTVYGFHFCAVAEPGGVWDFATKLVAPLVMRLDSDPPAFEMAAATENTSYQERINQIFPPRYQKDARETALTPEAMAELRSRFEAAVKG